MIFGFHVACDLVRGRLERVLRTRASSNVPTGQSHFGKVVIINKRASPPPGHSREEARLVFGSFPARDLGRRRLERVNAVLNKPPCCYT